MALDGPWGSGKTTFLKMWERCLKNKGHACVYLNAWTSDFAADPLVPLVAELSEQVVTQIPTLKKHLDQVKKIGVSILKRTIPVALQLATAGLLKAEDLTEAKLGELAGQIAEDQIKSYEEAKSAAEKFRSILGKIAQKVAETGVGNKIVVIIDELDRCRPTYAVELLERMKHLFDVDGVIFVLGIDRAQLSHSIKALYGTDFDASGYLKRFIDIDYRLPDPEPGRYCAYLVEKLGINDLAGGSAKEDGIDLGLLRELFLAAEFSLRQQDQTLGRLRVVLQTIPADQHLHGSMLSVLLVLRAWRSEFYAAIEGGFPDVDLIFGELEKGRKLPIEESEGFWNLIEATILSVGVSLTRNESHRLRDIREIAERDDSRPHAKMVMWWVNYHARLRGTSPVRTCLKRLALTEAFVDSPKGPP